MKIFLCLLMSMFFCTCLQSGVVFAEIVTGQAYIENGNIGKANADARKNAMRAYVEEKLGVQVKSTTEVVNNMLIRDSIVARSNGYLLVKKVVSEKILGEIYQVTLDLEASNDLINSIAKEVTAQLQAIDEDSSRNGVHVAIVDEDTKNTALWNSYFTGMLKEAGFRAEINDDVVLYLAQNINNSNDLKMNTEIRRLGRIGDRGSANAIIRGRVGLARKAEKITAHSYKAVAQVNCELIGYDNNTVDVAAGYYYYVAESAEQAEQMAKEVALRTAAEQLSGQALKTHQLEYRGGVHNIKVTLCFRGLNNKASQRALIVDALNGLNCRIIRSGFLPDNTLQLFVHADAYNNVEELKEAVLQQLRSSFPEMIDVIDPSQVGSTKLNFALWGA
ncbi:hypothetical protein [Phascolarctobacterium sp.]